MTNAHNKVVVIPLSGDESSTLQNVVTVALENGDFDNPVNAINSITDASASNTYLIVVAPGRYFVNQQLKMKEHVNLAGSGANITEIQGNFFSPPDSETSLNGAVLVSAKNSRVSDLTINNGAQGISSVGIGIKGNLAPDSDEVVPITDASPRFFNVNVRLSFNARIPSRGDAIVMQQYSSAVFDYVDLAMAKRAEGRGIYIHEGSNLIMRNSKVSTVCVGQCDAIEMVEGGSTATIQATEIIVNSDTNRGKPVLTFTNPSNEAKPTVVLNSFVQGPQKPLVSGTVNCSGSYTFAAQSGGGLAARFFDSTCN